MMTQRKFPLFIFSFIEFIGVTNYRGFRCTTLQHIICTLYCMFTTPAFSWICAWVFLCMYVIVYFCFMSLLLSPQPYCFSFLSNNYAVSPSGSIIRDSERKWLMLRLYHTLSIYLSLSIHPSIHINIHVCLECRVVSGGPRRIEWDVKVKHSE